MEQKDKQEKSKQRRTVMRALSYFPQIGFAIIACVFVGVFLGRGLDRLLGTSPWLLLVCSLLGAAAAFLQMFAITKK